MRKQEWIDAVVSHIEDEYQRNAIARQLDEKISGMARHKDEADVLRRLGDPDEYYEKHFSKRSACKVNYPLSKANGLPASSTS